MLIKYTPVSCKMFICNICINSYCMCRKKIKSSTFQITNVAQSKVILAVYLSYLTAWEGSYCSGDDGGVMSSPSNGALLSCCELNSRFTTPTSRFSRFAFGAVGMKWVVRCEFTQSRLNDDKHSCVTHWWADHPAGALCRIYRSLEPGCYVWSWRNPPLDSSKEKHVQINK